MSIFYVLFEVFVFDIIFVVVGIGIFERMGICVWVEVVVEVGRMVEGFGIVWLCVCEGFEIGWKFCVGGCCVCNGWFGIICWIGGGSVCIFVVYVVFDYCGWLVLSF